MALKAMERDGGVYIAPYVNMVTSVNREAYRNAFFIAGAGGQVLTAVLALSRICTALLVRFS